MHPAHLLHSPGSRTRRLWALAAMALLAIGLAALTALESAAPQDNDKGDDKAKAEPLPFNHKVEVYRSKDGLMVFALRLEQPFLAEEFDKSNFLRVRALDANGYLIYPSQAKFHQKHAEFYGRLRGEGKAHLRVTYEMVSENLDGSRKIVLHHGDMDVPIPPREGGPESIARAWAQQQNAYFLALLEYYPNDSFLPFALLQSQARHGVTPPPLPKPALGEPELEANLYHTFTSAAAVQEALQRSALTQGPRSNDLTVHIGQLSGPNLQSLPYEQLLAKKKEQNILPQVQDVARLIPQDQYCLQFRSLETAGSLNDLSTDWGDSLLRLFNVTSRDNRTQEKLEDQLILRRDLLSRLFADAVISDFALTGSDPFVVEGTDFTVLLRLTKPDVFDKTAEGWLDQARTRFKDALQEREFNYRGHRILARYTEDRVVSSFFVRLGDYAVYSNSHRAIRKMVDTFTGAAPRLGDALDYRYVTTLLPPTNDPSSGYLYASEAFIKRLISPAAKIAEKRRLQAYNNLIMINNASLLYRLENSASPTSLTDLIENRYLDPKKLVCPSGGVYSWDAKNDTGTSSVYNRLKYLTPNVEVPILMVSAQEQQQYDRFKQAYEAFWSGVFDPIAIRITKQGGPGALQGNGDGGSRVKLETCVLPMANGSLYQTLRDHLAKKTLPLRTAPIARSAVLSLLAVSGRKVNAGFLKAIPGVPEVLEADPTLTDLSFIGDRIGVHFCDDDSTLEVDPTLLKPLDQRGFKVGLVEQTVFSLGLAALKMPIYVSLDVEDKDKAARLLENLASRIPLKKGDFFGLPTALDAYRLPDYKSHPIYVLSYRIYALKVRLHIALVGDQLVAATKAKTLREVIDAALRKDERKPAEAHAMLRFNRRALDRLTGDLQLYWEEKSRQACHNNIMPIYTLTRLYGIPVAAVNRLSQAKYGVAYHCPDCGAYRYDPGADQVECTVHGNRQHSRQTAATSQESSFTRLLDRVEEITATLRFEEDALIATLEIDRAQVEKK
jgi:hypothetical protein